MQKDFNILALISGRGSNLESLIQKAKNYEILGILSNNPEAPGLALGVRHKIPTYPFRRDDYPSLKAFKAAIREKATSLAPTLICLAGFMQIVEKEFIDSFPSRIINIHPSLLPKFPGLHTHQRALDAHEKIHGCSVHVVDAGVDTGPIIAQAEVECLPNDTEESLSSRVLAREHEIYPWVTNLIASGDIKLGGSKIVYSTKAREEASGRKFLIPNP